jgi:hypothetical protein
LGLPYRDGTRKLIYRDGAWQDHTEPVITPAVAAEVTAVLTDPEVQAATAKLSGTVDTLLPQLLKEHPELAQVPPEQLQQSIEQGLTRLLQQALQESSTSAS